MSRLHSHSLAILLLRLTLSAVFFWAAIPKLQDPASFATALQNYKLFPNELVAYLAVIVPTTEVLVAICLLWTPWSRAAALISLCMYVIFSISVSQAIVRGIDLSCGCFGSNESRVSWWQVGRNIVLAGFSCWVTFSPMVSWRAMVGRSTGRNP